MPGIYCSVQTNTGIDFRCELIRIYIPNHILRYINIYICISSSTPERVRMVCVHERQWLALDNEQPAAFYFSLSLPRTLPLKYIYTHIQAHGGRAHSPAVLVFCSSAYSNAFQPSRTIQKWKKQKCYTVAVRPACMHAHKCFVCLQRCGQAHNQFKRITNIGGIVRRRTSRCAAVAYSMGRARTHECVAHERTHAYHISSRHHKARVAFVRTDAVHTHLDVLML